MNLRVREAHCIQIPCRMGQPLLCPAPVLILTRDGKSFVEGNAVFIIHRGGNAVDDRSRRVCVFIRAEEHVRGVVMTAPHQHAGVVRVSSQNPVQLVPGIALQLRLESRIRSEQWRSQTSGTGQRAKASIFSLPPRRRFRVMRKEEGAAYLSIAHLHKLPRIAEWIVVLICHAKLKTEGALYCCAHLLLLRSICDLQVLEQTNHWQSSIGWVEVWPLRIVGTPVIAIRPLCGKSRHKLFGSLISCSAVDLLVCCLIKRRRSH